MPSYLAVYEDSAPFLSYAGSWRAGTSGDNLADRYSESSFFVTEELGASVSFTFYGTEVTILGSKRGNHGLYQGSLDGVTSTPANGGGPDQFLATLYTAKTGKGFHNVTLTNRENKFLDVDQVSWLASVGQDNEPLIVNTRQDSHPAFVYTPSNAWTSSPPAVGTFSGGTGQVRCALTGYTTLLFDDVGFLSGDAVALYGPAGPAVASSYSVQVDNRPPSFHSAVKQFYRPRQLLYYGGGLGAGTHTLTIKLEATSDRSQVLGIDYAEIYTTPSLGGSFDSTLSTPVGLYVGLALLGVVALLGLCLLTYIYILYKRKRFNFAPAKKNDLDMLAEGYTGPGYQPEPVVYPQSMTTQYAPSSNIGSSYPSIPSPPTQQEYRYAPTVGSTSLAYYQPSTGGIANDERSITASSTTASSSRTNPSGRVGLPPRNSIRKNRLYPTNASGNQDDAAPLPAPPPPAYNTGT